MVKLLDIQARAAKQFPLDERQMIRGFGDRSSAAVTCSPMIASILEITNVCLSKFPESNACKWPHSNSKPASVGPSQVSSPPAQYPKSKHSSDRLNRAMVGTEDARSQKTTLTLSN